jgi:subtilisin family serine protease
VIRAAALVLAGALLVPAAVRAAGAFQPTDPLVPRQWYLDQDRAFDYWLEAPSLSPVRVAVVDSGIDGGHPEFAGRIAKWKSFVGGSALVDTAGHGTFVAGEIAAATDNGEGIAGMVPSAELLIAKVVNVDGEVPLRAEVEAIRWAADNGAQVINLSLGGVRDPLDPKQDAYSPLEQAAVDYAYSKGAVVVAAVGNGPQSPATPWPYAHYPAALPHVIGVAALAADGSVPRFSNRDALYVDVAAPGKGVFSTLPRAITGERPACPDQGYSSCGTKEFTRSEGTSFAAPQVTAAAALLLATNPGLRPEQVTALIERSAVDVNPATGCADCRYGRDRFTGWGRLDVSAALDLLDRGVLVPIDRFESNDDAGPWARALWGRHQAVEATLDFWDDHVDVYRVKLRKGERLFARLTLPKRADVSLRLWKPGTKSVESLRSPQSFRAAQSSRIGLQERLGYRAPRTGWYYLEARLASPGASPYTLSLAKAG